MREWPDHAPHARLYLARQLKLARREAGLDQAEVASRLGIGSRSILSELEQGRRRLDVIELAALAGLYGKDPSWFFPAVDRGPGPSADKLV